MNLGMICLGIFFIILIVIIVKLSKESKNINWEEKKGNKINKRYRKKHPIDI